MNIFIDLSFGTLSMEVPVILFWVYVASAIKSHSNVSTQNNLVLVSYSLNCF